MQHYMIPTPTDALEKPQATFSTLCYIPITCPNGRFDPPKHHFTRYVILQGGPKLSPKVNFFFLMCIYMSNGCKICRHMAHIKLTFQMYDFN